MGKGGHNFSMNLPVYMYNYNWRHLRSKEKARWCLDVVKKEFKTYVNPFLIKDEQITLHLSVKTFLNV